MKFDILKVILICLLASGQHVSALDEYLLSFLPEIADRIAESNAKYRALIDSASLEYTTMRRAHHARVVSRIGFVTEDMQTLQVEVTEAIDSRADEIGNLEAVCIVEARRGLESAATAAGIVFHDLANNWYTELHLLNDVFIEPNIDELESFISTFQVETMLVFAFYNTVTEMDTAIPLLYLESVLYSILFEIFVNEFYTDFFIFESETNQKNARFFPLLDAALVDYQLAANSIRNSLSNCTA